MSQSTGSNDPSGRRRSGEVKLSSHFGAFTTYPNEAALGALAEGECQGVDQNRFAGTGFPGQGAKTRWKLELQSVDQYEVANRQAAEHGLVVAGMG